MIHLLSRLFIYKPDLSIITGITFVFDVARSGNPDTAINNKVEILKGEINTLAVSGSRHWTGLSLTIKV